MEYRAIIFHSYNPLSFNRLDSDNGIWNINRVFQLNKLGIKPITQLDV